MTRIRPLSQKIIVKKPGAPHCGTELRLEQCQGRALEQSNGSVRDRVNMMGAGGRAPRNYVILITDFHRISIDCNRNKNSKDDSEPHCSVESPF